ncbi:MAG TPA: cobalamin-independent methionine synthase II family protein [Chloroflexota bacterium]|nr:cobalamin-independent methionine synthase II family protein [Chloroflexota bacterium]
MSAERILTTHTGSLPRPVDLAEMMVEYSNEGRAAPGLWSRVDAATTEVVARQAAIGIDILNDGEFGKASYAGYVKERLNGFGGAVSNPARVMQDQEDFPDWVRSNAPRITYPGNNGPISAKDATLAGRDIARLKAAVASVRLVDVFMPAASPGVIETFMPTTYYKSDEEYLAVLADHMRGEYRAVVDAGFILQVDCPDLAMSRHTRFRQLSNAEFLKVAALHVEVLNHALEGLPRERLRLHLCWGNYEGPHRSDIPLKEIVGVALGAHVGALSFEAANPRHAHEWAVFEQIKLPDDFTIIPGVIDSCTNYIEHPELVAQRLVRFAGVVGRERVMASTDCGFGTSVGPRHVSGSVAWAKLESLVEGARLASAELWSS